MLMTPIRPYVMARPSATSSRIEPSDRPVNSTPSRSPQASRAATYLGLSDDPPLAPGATLFLDAACAEGLGEGDGERAFAAVLAAGATPWGALLDGPAPVGAGTQRAIMLAATLRRFPIVVCGVADPAPLRALGLDASAAPAESLAPADALVVADPFGKLPRFARAPMGSPR